MSKKQYPHMQPFNVAAHYNETKLHSWWHKLGGCYWANRKH